MSEKKKGERKGEVGERWKEKVEFIHDRCRSICQVKKGEKERERNLEI